MTKLISKRKLTQRAFLITMLVVFAVLFLATMDDYGIGWDCWEYYVGDKNLAFFAHADPHELNYLGKAPGYYCMPDHPDFHGIAVSIYRTPVRSCPYEIWPLGSLMSSISKQFGWRLFGMDVIDAHHLFLVLIAVLILCCVWKFAAGSFGLVVANCAVVFLACHPRFIANVHVNFKDVPGMLFFVLCVAFFYKAVKRRATGCVYVSTIFWGFGMATSSLAWTAPLVLMPWFILVLALDPVLRQRIVSRRWVVSLLLYPLVGILVSLLVWPFLLTDFPNTLELYLQSVLQRGAGGESYFSLLPMLRAFAMMPLSLIGFALIGLFSVSVSVIRKQRRPHLLILLLLWMLVPVFRICLPGANDFDGLRHWIHVLAPASIFAGLGLGYVLRLLQGRIKGPEALIAGLAALLVCCPVIWWNARNHPYQVCFYNTAIGGLDSAQELRFHDATDYWGQSYRRGIDWLNQHAEQNAYVAFGVAEHIGALTRNTWFREDLRFLPIADQTDDWVREKSRQRPVYIMFVTHKEGLRATMDDLSSTANCVHRVKVDGGDVLMIYKLAQGAD